MLSGEGNENGEKTTKKKLLDVQHTFFCTFLCRCFTRLQRETSRNFLVTRFMEEISYLFLFTLFFFTAAHFHLGGRQHFSFSQVQNFHILLPQKIVSFVFHLSLQLSVVLFILQLRWPVASFLFFSVFLFLYIPNFWT